MITRVFVSDPEMNKQKNKTKNCLEIFEFSIIPKKKPRKIYEAISDKFFRKNLKGDMRNKGNITSCMSSIETEDLDNDM